MVFCVLVRLLSVLGGSETVADLHWALLGDDKLHSGRGSPGNLGLIIVHRSSFAVVVSDHNTIVRFRCSSDAHHQSARFVVFA